MSDDTTPNQKLRAHKNTYVRIASLGATIWNRWIADGVESKDHQNLPSGMHKLSAGEAEQIARSIGLNSLPDPKIPVNFENEEIPVPLDFSGYVFLNTKFDGATFHNVVKFNEARFLREAHFEKACFEFPVHFRRTSFFDDVSFEGSKLPRVINFDLATFYGTANFRNATFLGSATFQSCLFYSAAVFADVSFEGDTNFSNTTITGEAEFTTAQFKGTVKFNYVKFASDARFVAAPFHDHAEFLGITCQGSINFDAITSIAFERSVKFDKSVFSDAVRFNNRDFRQESSWVNAEFRTLTSFCFCEFLEPPRFHGTKFHEDTNWLDTKFNQGTTTHPSDASRCWRVLKQSMIQIHDYENELKFFALELDAKRLYGSMQKRAWYFAYKLFSNYGLSVRKPFLWLMGTAFVAFAANLILANCVDTCGCEMLHHNKMDIFAITLTSTIPFAGLSRVATDLANTLFDPAIRSLTYAISVIHGLLSGLFIFLILLAVRNRFRIK